MAITRYILSLLLLLPFVATAQLDISSPHYVAEFVSNHQGGGGGGPAWYDNKVASPVDTTDTTTFSNLDSVEYCPITIGQSGDITKLRMWIQLRFGAQNLKLAVFDDAGDLLGYAAAGSPGSAGVYFEQNVVTPIPVTMGQVIFFQWVADGGNLAYRYLDGGGDFYFDGTAGGYDAAPAATLPTLTPSAFSRGYAVGVYVEP